jgi:pseudouridine-5'-phosphate glycosidase
VALESTVITHGLPYPQNLETLYALEKIVRDSGSVPATIIMLNGKVHVGLEQEELDLLEILLKQQTVWQKLSTRDLPLALSRHQNGGTTVSATMQAAALCGISVFATGGIGGVHRDWQKIPDISMDLMAFTKYPVMVVSAGCKAILDIPATIELLESMGVPVYGWKTDKFPTFYSSSSSYDISRIDSEQELCTCFQVLNQMSCQSSGILVANPIPQEYEIPSEEIEPTIIEAILVAQNKSISGKGLTPFLLSYLAQSTGGRSVTANLHLLENNARLAARIANHYAKNYHLITGRES